MTHAQAMITARAKIQRAVIATRRDLPFTATIAKREAREMLERARAIRNGETK